jgi:hypothetical protein
MWRSRICVAFQNVHCGVDSLSPKHMMFELWSALNSLGNGRLYITSNVVSDLVTMGTWNGVLVPTMNNFDIEPEQAESLPRPPASGRITSSDHQTFWSHIQELPRLNSQRVNRFMPSGCLTFSCSPHPALYQSPFRFHASSPVLRCRRH